MDFDSLQDDGAQASPLPSPQAAPSVGPAPASQVSQPAQQAPQDFDSLQDDNAAMYGSPKEEFKAGVEKVAKGFAGPVATGVEKLFGARDADIQGRSDQFDEQHPVAGPVLEGAGLVGGALTGVGEGAALEHLGAAGAKAAGLGEPVGYGAKVAASTVKAALENATYQAGDETSKMMMSDPNQSAQTAIAHIGLSAALGAGIGGTVAGAISPLWNATVGNKLQGALDGIVSDATGEPNVSGPKVNPILKKVLSTFGGVSEADIDNYAANRAAINSLPESDEIYQHALSHIEGINQKVADAHQAVQDASGTVAERSQAVSEAQSAYSDLESRVKQEYRNQGYDAGQATKMSKQALAQAQEKLATDVQTRALNTANPIVNAIDTLHQNVVNQSRNSFDILAKDGAVVDLGDFYAKGKSLADDLRAQSTLESTAQANKLEQYLAHVKSNYGEANVAAPNAKVLIQGLDAISSYDYNATSFDKALSRQYKQLRYALDDSLKTQIPEYKAAMAPLAGDVRLLKDLKPYGEEASATRRLKGIKAPDRYKNDMDLLRQLESRTGAKFTSDIEPYANPKLNASMHDALPEYAEHQKNASISESLKDPRNIQLMQEKLAQTPEYRRVLEAQAAKEEALKAKETAIAAKEQALKLKDGIKGVTPASLEGKLASAARGKIDPARVLEGFPELQGKSLPELLKLQKTAQAFNKGAMNGSRNVNMFGALGSAAGMAVEHGMGGLATGATLGGFADKYGPKAVQKVLDLYLDKFGGTAAMAGVSPEASKVAISKMLESGGPAKASSFKAAADYAHSVMKGETLLNKAAKGVFKAGQWSIPTHLMPDEKSRDRLDQKLKGIQKNPGKLQDVGGKTADYLPAHGEAIATTTSAAANYLNSIRPSAAPASPLDQKAPITKQKQAEYNNALNIAQQPLIVIHKLQSGTLTPQDLQHLNAMYPAMYKSLSQKLTSGMADALDKGQAIPYKTRIGLSLMLAQPMDSTLTGPSILAAQPQASQPEEPASGSGGKPKGSTKTLGSIAKAAMTTGQSREQDRSQPA